MKKFGIVLAVLFIVSSGAWAQFFAGDTTIGGAFTFYNYSEEANAHENENLTILGGSLVQTYFVGDGFGFYNRASVGFIGSISSSTSGESLTPSGTTYLVALTIGLGYEHQLDESLSIVAGIGPGLSGAGMIAEEVQFAVVSIGAGADVSIRYLFTESLGIQGGVATNFDFVSYLGNPDFISAFVVQPYVGLTLSL
ncbi:MAG: DUF2715 domain-containing protein [Spirochaetales bacterium]